MTAEPLSHVPAPWERAGYSSGDVIRSRMACQEKGARLSLAVDVPWHHLWWDGRAWSADPLPLVFDPWDAVLHKPR